jgi:hypothetical protein
MSVEATLFLLEKPGAKYHPLSIHICCLNHIWHGLLANWFDNVSTGECSAKSVYFLNEFFHHILYKNSIFSVFWHKKQGTTGCV